MSVSSMARHQSGEGFGLEIKSTAAFESHFCCVWDSSSEQGDHGGWERGSGDRIPLDHWPGKETLPARCSLLPTGLSVKGWAQAAPGGAGEAGGLGPFPDNLGPLPDPVLAGPANNGAV